MIRSKTSECMTIDKPMFRIGKQREYVDLFIGENTAISRNHANIIECEGQYYIVTQILSITLMSMGSKSIVM